MIKYLQNKKVQKAIYIVLAVVVVVGFGLSGILIGDKSDPSQALAQFDNKKITVQDYLKSYRAIDREIRMHYGDRAQEVRSKLNLKGEAWDRILLLLHAQKNKIKTSDSEVVQWLMDQPAFFSKNQFDDTLYKMYVRNYMRMEPREFEEAIRESLTLDKVRAKVGEQASLTDEVLRDLYTKKYPEYDIAYGVIPWEKSKVGIEVEDSEISKIYDVVKDNLTAPAGPDETQEKKLTPDEAKEQLKSTLLKQKAIDAGLTKLKEAKIAMAKDGSDFEKILADKGVDLVQIQHLSHGTDLPLMGPSMIAEEAVSTLKEGEVAEPVSIGNGAAIIKMLKKLPSDPKNFEKNKESFRSEMSLTKKDEEMKKLLEKLRSDLKLNLELMKKIFPEDEISEK